MIRVFFCRCGGSYTEQHAAVYGLLCTAASLSGYDVTRLELKKTPSGKPYFAEADGHEAEVHFSLSHSGNLAVCAIGDAPCGIDAEIKPVPERVVKRFFPGCTDKDEAQILWTRRESAGKLDGRGFFAKPDPAVAFRTFLIDGFTVTVCFNGNESVRLF